MFFLQYSFSAGNDLSDGARAERVARDGKSSLAPYLFYFIDKGQGHQ
jgi:hypothetical protein